MIRAAEERDTEDIYRMICALENTELDHDAFVQIRRHQSADQMYICLVYETDGEVHGVLNMRIESQLHHAGPVAEIMELFVDEEYRSQGHGAKLLETAVQTAKDRGCLRAELSSSCWRRDAHRFYQRCGFEMSHVNLTYDLV